MDNLQLLSELLEISGNDNILTVFTDLEHFPLKIRDKNGELDEIRVQNVKLTDTVEEVSQKIKNAYSGTKWI